ncbi:MAG: hypothetical protein IIT65_02515 [Lachnospiraceae bacterium]|nr:hypothetical protein [Lachnospiraceae bacterium]
MYVIREKYKDWLGNDREEDFRFNISKSELTKMQFSKDGGFDVYLKRVMDSQSQSELMKVFEEILAMSYGVISDDGRDFVKTPEVLAKFESTVAYDNIYMRLVSDSNFASEFVNNVFPAELIKQAKENDDVPAISDAGKIVQIDKK